VIVGVGASAGGLEAFTRLVHHLAPDAGLAYVLVQHLARDQESFLSELLGRATAIPVEQARDGVRIEPNRAYVIPPDTTMSVRDGHLSLVRRPKGGGLHLPIDTFLASLAEVHGPAAVAVILSGAGSDGARGVEAIKEMGGITFAQDSKSARHPSMPEAAVATGTVDFVLPPEEIAERLNQIGRHVVPSSDTEERAEAAPAADEDDRLAILKLLHRRTGVDFTDYRRGTVDRRILRRMLVHRLAASSEYVALIRRDVTELDLLYEDLLIGVTSFFRDPDVFEELRATVFPELIATRPPGAPIRVWVPGCSGGEETYSLAIALIESLDAAGVDAPIQLFGTDLSELSVARARAGVYPSTIAEHVSAERLRRFFVKDLGRYRIAKQIRDLCVFSRQNIVRDPPFSHLDLISCRNVLIYFDQALQRRVFPIFHYALESHGVLVLGSAESPGLASELFAPFSKGHKIYRRREAPVRPLNLDFSAPPIADRTGAAGTPPEPGTGGPQAASDSNPLGGEIDRAILAAYGGQGVVVTEDFEIVHVRGDVAPYLTLRPGSASLDLLRMARPELVMPLRVLVGRAGAENARATERVAFSDGGATRYVVLDTLPIPPASRRPRLFTILFSEDSEPAAPLPESSPTVNAAANEVASLREELAATKSYLGEIIEQHGATVEELRSAGEEIQSSNEELQSTNEELETTKEEIQSTNEELTTLNEELRNRNQELGALASDLANVFANTPIPIVIVGRDHRLRRFTPAAARVLRVLPSDAGRPISDIRLNFAFHNLDQLITKTVETLEASEHAVRDDTGAWWLFSIRPYQTVDRRVGGAVLVFTDIDKPKRAEEHATELSDERGRALVTAEEARIAELARTNKALAASLAERDRAQEDRNALLRQLGTAQEDERRRLSRELHDEAGQHLTALALGLRALSDIELDESETRRRADELSGLVATLGEEIHRIALRLRPKALDDFGLEAAISGYAQEWSDRSGIAAVVQVDDAAERLSGATETAAYRVVQEALTNVARHSAATHASVLVERRDGYLRIIVEDDGVGFDSSRVGRGPGEVGEGIGLLGIRERIELLNGTVDIESEKGQGTTLFVRIPIADDRSRESDASRNRRSGL
jgi:two-component system CheB/CheR fusion protein